MKVTCFSSFTFSYLNRARVLFASLQRFHPEWDLVALITDEPPPGFTLRLRDEPFDRRGLCRASWASPTSRPGCSSTTSSRSARR